MINNRQGGRRRGRGGQRGQNLGGQPGNRQDNRQRGNAAQLLEKYKNLARDAQLAGDRVQNEYYLQYADHYFRVLGESRARFEDQRRQRGDEVDEEEGDEELVEAGEEQAGDERQERPDRRERPDRHARHDRPRRRFEREERAAEGSDDDGRVSRMNGPDEGIPLDVLPPAIGADGPVAVEPTEEAEAPRPRRRARAPRPDDSDTEVVPAA